MTMKFSQFPKKATTAQNFEAAGLQDGQNALLDLTELDNKADSGIEQAGVALSTANQAQLDATEALELIAQGGVGGGNALINSTPTIEGSTTQYIRAMRIEYPLNAYGGGLMYMQFGEARAQLVFTYNDSGAIEFRLELVRGVSSTGLPFKGGVLISEIQPGQWDVFFKRVSGNSAVKAVYWSDVAVQTSGITVEHFAEVWTATAPMGVSIVDVYSWIGDDGRLYIDKDIVLPQLETDKLTYIDSNGRLKASSLTKAVSEGLDGRLTTTEGKVTALETNSATKTELNNGLATREPKIPTGVAGQFYAHDKTWKTPPQPDLSGYATTTDLNNGLATREPKVTADGSSTSFWNGLKNWVKVKLSDLTGGANNRVLVTNSSGTVTNSSTTRQELECLQGVTSNVQAQFDNRLKLEFANFCRINVATANGKWYKLFEYPKATARDGKMFFDVHYWNSTSRSGLLIIDGAFDSSTNVFDANARVSYLGLNSDYDPSKLALCYNSSTDNIEFYARYVTSADRIALSPRAIVEGVKGLTYFVQSSGIDNLAAFNQKVIGTQMNLTAGAITLSNLSSNAGYIPTLDADGKLIKGASNGTSVVAGELQLYDLANHTRVPYIDANKRVKLSDVTPTELSYLSGVTGNVQAQVDNRLKISDQNEWQAHYAQGSNPYIRYAKVTTTVTGNWNEYYQQFQIAVGKAYYYNQRYLNGTFLIELGTRQANENLDPKIMFYGHRSSNEQLFYKTTTTSGGVINGIEIWGYSSGSTGTDCIVNVSVVHQRAQYSSYDLTKSTSVTAPSGLVEIPYMLMQGTRFYTSGNATIGGDLSAQNITATDAGKVSSFAGGISVPTGKNVAIGSGVALSSASVTAIEVRPYIGSAPPAGTLMFEY
jgi:hypothetical protein